MRFEIFFCCGPKSLATCFELCHGDLLKNILLVVVAVFVWPAVVVFVVGVVTVFAAFVAVFVAVFVAPFAIVFVVAVLYYVGCLCHRAFWLSFGWQTREREHEVQSEREVGIGGSRGSDNNHNKRSIFSLLVANVFYSL